MRATFLIAVAVSALALSGCGSSSDQTAATPALDGVAGTTAAEASNLDISSSAKNSETQSEFATEFSEEDSSRLRAYGTCLSILKAEIWLINQHNLARDPAVKLMRGTLAHQAAIYQILSVEIVGNYPDEMRDSAVLIQNEFMNRNILGKTLRLEKLRDLEKENCNFADISSQSGDIMKNYPDTYRDEVRLAESTGA